MRQASPQRLRSSVARSLRSQGVPSFTAKAPEDGHDRPEAQPGGGSHAAYRGGKCRSADLSGAASDHRGAGLTGRGDRPARPRARQALQRERGSAGDRREQARGEQPDRGRIRRQGGARRQHAVRRSGVDLRGESVPLPRLPYDPVKDFTPITGLVTIHHALITHPSLPVASVRDLLDLARKRPGELNYGTYGIGSSGHLNMEVLQRDAHIKLTPVHYKGASPALTDVIAGHIQLMFISLGTAAPQWKAGKVRMLAIGAPQRLASLPDMPTIAESGVPGFEAASWFALYGPANMPPEVVAKVNREVRALFADEDFRKSFLAPQFFEPIADTPEKLADYLKSETAKWRQVIRDANIKVE